MKKPPRMHLANLPTPILPLEHLSYPRERAVIYMKRDDFAGLEMSGNKVRKLEFAMQQGLTQGADMFITCGGIQSNHARATAAACARIGKKAHLVLKGKPQEPDGNYFLDLLLGAEVTFISEEDYQYSRNEIMKDLGEEYRKKGLRTYLLPEGASNGIGFFGYYEAYEEILSQEKQMNLHFDTICVADGSSGTYAGLYAANELYEEGKQILGFNIYDAGAAGKDKIAGIIREGLDIGEETRQVSMDRIAINYGYVGEGYGISSPEVIALIARVARETGVVLDPVYTGKAMYGLLTELEKGNPRLSGNILFIHTGGQFGTFPHRARFQEWF